MIPVTQVALLAEGVDRNCTDVQDMFILAFVALLAEGVDRNFIGDLLLSLGFSRPPRGGRG